VIDLDSGARNNIHNNQPEGEAMNDFNRKVEETTVRVGRKVGETSERLEQEAAQFIKYLNDEVVPAVRQHSTKALRIAAEKMQELANYMEQNSASRK
jgi:hypothetical protein